MKSSKIPWVYALILLGLSGGIETRIKAQTRPAPPFTRRGGTTIPQTMPDLSDDSLKSFINDVFMTAQQVRPELRAAGLRQLGAIVLQMDPKRALWVYNQAFEAARLIPISSRMTMRENMERQIILDEAKLDLSQAIDHALQLGPDPVPADPGQPHIDEKLLLLTDLIRRIPEDDATGLFQKAAPALVREDEHFIQTLSLAHAFQKTRPERTQQLFSEALSQFQSQNPDELSFRSFAMLTMSLGLNNPSLAQTGIDLLLKKADELDAQKSTASTGSVGLSNPTGDVIGSHRLSVYNQLLSLMQKIDPTRANDWTSQLNARKMTLNSNPLGMPAPVNVNPTNQNLPPNAPAASQQARNRRSSTQQDQGSTPGRQPAVLGSGSGIADASGPGSRSTAPGSSNSQDYLSQQQMISMARQPASAFSQQLNTSIIKAQAAAKNDVAEFTRSLEEIMPSIQREADPRAKASALVQISLAYFQMGDHVKGQQYLSESLARSREGDAQFLSIAQSAGTFFVAYCATSNVVSRLATLFPKEAIDAIKTIPDVQLRFRVMIDNLGLLNVLSSIGGFKPS